VLACSAFSQAPAPAGLTGVVSAGDAPLAGVTVQAVRAGSTTPSATATTGADGKYLLSSLAQGVYRIEFSCAGFVPLTRAGIVVFSGSVAELNATMTRLSTAPAAAAAPSASDLRALLKTGEVGVRIETKFGVIVVAVDPVHAPATAANFLKYVDGGFYDGGRFHRATRPDNYPAAPPNRPMMEIIQGGINPERKGKSFPPIALERTSVTGLKHVRGTVSMARGAADTATSDFFILLDDQPSLDFGGKRFDDEQGAAAFGRVIAGLEVVRRIQQEPVQGQSLSPPVPIIRMARLG
jgi:peptidyl-prolyl cis-trans isomerase A (cyclophilin A)